MGHLSTALATRLGHPCTSTSLVTILAQEWPKIIAEIQSYATMILDHITATMTYVTWFKEHLTNISVLHRFTFPVLLLLLLLLLKASRNVKTRACGFEANRGQFRCSKYTDNNNTGSTFPKYAGTACM
jgi:hypothetical protein